MIDNCRTKSYAAVGAQRKVTIARAGSLRKLLNRRGYPTDVTASHPLELFYY